MSISHTGTMGKNGIGFGKLCSYECDNVLGRWQLNRKRMVSTRKLKMCRTWSRMDFCRAEDKLSFIIITLIKPGLIMQINSSQYENEYIFVVCHCRSLLMFVRKVFRFYKSKFCTSLAAHPAQAFDTLLVLMAVMFALTRYDMVVLVSSSVRSVRILF